ncbi:MAG: ABC transporter permease [Mesorhizobium sp.]|uniref:ABC transporter permease n=1 Tax=Mesorhizobium sp. TaxID=1871066 RepID=UPI000FE52BD3|nr:ABC transporter permease [Mesorhizobium sp.]RWB96371.1 MAG: ABC transporter permease [Mesorhizobium sp.]
MHAKPFAKRSVGSRQTSAREYGPVLSLLLITPLILLMVGGFLYPVGKLFWGSIFVPEASFANYARILQEPLFLLILCRTFENAFVVSASALLLGYPVALAMARVSGRTAMLIAACVLIPLWTSVLVRSYAWIVLLQRNGVVNNALIDTGLTDTPLRLLYTRGAVMAAMTQVLLPFMILPIYSVVRNIPGDLARAARNLGAGSIQAFIRVTLPLSLPGVTAGVLITFILSLGFYITPALVGGPSTLMMSTLIGQQTTELLDWPFAGALAAVLLAATLLLVIVFRRALALNKGFKLG